MKKLIDMTPAERAEIMEAWVRGETVYLRAPNAPCKWYLGTDSLNLKDEYELPPKFELDWSAVHKDVAYAECINVWALYTKNGPAWTVSVLS